MSAGALLTIDQVAKRLNVSPAYVRRRLVFEHRIAYVKIGRHVRIDETDVDELINRGRVTPLGLENQNGHPPTRTQTSREGRRRWPTSGNTR